jgi:hypothetical protein
VPSPLAENLAALAGCVSSLSYELTRAFEWGPVVDYGS